MTPRISFDILPTHDAKYLKIYDTSDWKHLIDDQAYISILLPAKTTPVTHNFTKGGLNIYNSINLSYNTSLVPLPDGIYEITLQTCVNDKFAYKACLLRTVRFQERLDNIIVKMNLCCNNIDKNVSEKYLEIDLLLQSAHINVRNGYISQGMCEYEKAKELLEEFENCYEKGNCK